MSSTPSKRKKVLRPLPAIPSPRTPQCPTSSRPLRPLPSPPCTSLPSASPPKCADLLTPLDSLPGSSAPSLRPLSSVASALKVLPEVTDESQPPSILNSSKPHEAPDRLEPLHLPKLCPNRLRQYVDELILDDSDGWINSMNRTLPDKKILPSDDRLLGPAHVRAAISENVLGIASEKVTEESEEETEGKTVRIDCFQPSIDAEFHFNSRFSSHWLREQQGRRLEEEDYQSVLKTLRSLRC
ncbi:hypothetical protein C0993_007870 [Termitomyces sp. T159_Od127]|nr:hypothetical protein C0993_007870 [Termitomyces sp. T159_Od127]